MTAITLDDFTAKQLGKCCQWDVPGRFAHEMDEEANIQRVASQVAARHRLAMADAAMYSMAQEFGATFWTQDVDYRGLNCVQYCAKPGAAA